MRSKLGVPTAPPDTVAPAPQRLHNTTVARILGGFSFIRLKTPREGFQRQDQQLGAVRKDYQLMELERVYMMGLEQQAVFNGQLLHFVVFGGHGSGNLHIW